LDGENYGYDITTYEELPLLLPDKKGIQVSTKKEKLMIIVLG
jgi:hypothetical protein